MIAMLVLDHHLSQTGKTDLQTFYDMVARLMFVAAKCTSLHVGTASDYMAQAQEHENEDPTRWADMLVLYQTSSKDRVRDLQKRLMDYIGTSNTLQKKLTNALDVAKTPTTDPPYYLYILRAFDEKKVLN
jgi:hypothetical protein